VTFFGIFQGNNNREATKGICFGFLSACIAKDDRTAMKVQRSPPGAKGPAPGGKKTTLFTANKHVANKVTEAVRR
jgi:hypothetical protein